MAERDDRWGVLVPGTGEVVAVSDEHGTIPLTGGPAGCELPVIEWDEQGMFRFAGGAGGE